MKTVREPREEEAQMFATYLKGQACFLIQVGCICRSPSFHSQWGGRTTGNALMPPHPKHPASVVVSILFPWCCSSASPLPTTVRPAYLPACQSASRLHGGFKRRRSPLFRATQQRLGRRQGGGATGCVQLGAPPMLLQHQASVPGARSGTPQLILFTLVADPLGLL